MQEYFYRIQILTNTGIFIFVSEYSLSYLFLQYETELSERQKEIINASLEIIAENGIQSLTIKNLSKKIGLVESAIYRHYESKTQILDCFA